MIDSGHVYSRFLLHKGNGSDPALVPMVQDFLSNLHSFKTMTMTMEALVDGAGTKSRSMIIAEGSMEPDA